VQAGGFVKKLDHGRERNKKAIRDKSNQIDYKRNDSPHGAEQEPDKSDKAKWKNM
jgi:hypothetical protein